MGVCNSVLVVNQYWCVFLSHAEATQKEYKMWINYFFPFHFLYQINNNNLITANDTQIC